MRLFLDKIKFYGIYESYGNSDRFGIFKKPVMLKDEEK